MSNEIWKSVHIDKYSELYKVSNLGNVMGKMKKNLKQHTRCGYNAVYLENSKEKCSVTISVHILVANVFIAKPVNNIKLIINHKDGNKLNNYVDNLEWVTNQQNNIHAYDNGLKTSYTRGVKVFKDGEMIKIYDSIIQAAKDLGVRDNRISQVCKKKRKTHKGYYFEYVIENINEYDTFIIQDCLQMDEFPYYYISKDGKIYSIRSKKYIRTRHDGNGYEIVTLYNGKTKKDLLVHRIVAELYIPNPKNKPMVNHKDSNKKNNNHTNLEWVSASENMKHYYNYRKALLPN